MRKRLRGDAVSLSYFSKMSVSRETSPTFRLLRTQGCLFVVLSTTSCCTLKISVSCETFRFFAFFRPPFLLRFSSDDAVHHASLFGLGEHESGIRMQLSCSLAFALDNASCSQRHVALCLADPKSGGRLARNLIF